VNSLKTFFPYVRKYRREFIFGISALIITDSMTLLVPWLIKEFIDVLPEKPAMEQLIKIIFLLFVISLVLILGRYGWRKYMFGMSRNIEFDILNKIFKCFLGLDRMWYQKQKTGDLMSRATNDIRAVREFFGLGILILIDAIFVIVLAVSMMCLISADLTLKVFIPLPLISFLFFYFVDEIGKRHREVQEHLAKITNHVQENLSGIRVIHAFVQEENEKKKFDNLNEEFIKKNLRVTRMFGIFTPSMVFVVGLAGMISLWMGSKEVISGNISLGSFVAFNGYLMLLSWPMMGIGYVFNLTQKGIAGMDRINEVFASKSVVQSIQNIHHKINPGDIKISNLYFKYSENTPDVLKGIEVNIPKGQTLGIVGSIGSGKTTLVQLLLRFFDPVSGEILINGKPIREFPLNSLRDYIGYVNQEPFLFSTTIRNNIALGNDNVSDFDILQAIELAGLKSDLEKFPDHLETLIGEKGVTLSGGQKQRVALARTFLKKPEILVLDDSFSNLDSETESLLLDSLRTYFKDMTKIIISHRLSSILSAENIIVIEDGKIIEEGNHTKLLSLGNVYANLFREQELAKEMEIIL